jgi:hypothetical protein
MRTSLATPARGARAAARSIVLLAALLMTVALLPAVAGAQEVPGDGFPTTDDPRYGLGGGEFDAETAAEGLEHLDLLRKDEGEFFNENSFSTNVGLAIGTANSDIAFTGDHVLQGNWRGFSIIDVSDPASPEYRTQVVCPGGQHDITVHGNLMFMSVEATNATIDCGTTSTPANTPDQDRFRGVRIFDISDLDEPVQVGYVQTCRGSHTHRLVEDINDDSVVYIYNNGTSSFRHPDEAGLNCTDHPLTTEPVYDDEEEDIDRWQIEVIRVPLDAPGDAEIVNEARLFAGEDGRLNGLQNTQSGTQHPCATDEETDCGRQSPTAENPAGSPTTTAYSPLPNTNTCHDITVYPEFGIAAGACQGNGILIDISDPANPERIAEVSDPNFSYWHSANFNNDATQVMFTDEWGGGTGPRCRETDRLAWGANAMFNIVEDAEGNRSLEFTSYYKLPVAQEMTENCVAHQANILPVPGRDILVQAWYQGGISMLDWTDPENPFEIGYFDRGPINEVSMVLGGHWSGYWYNGYIFGSEIARGLDTLDLVETDHLSANEIAASKSVQLDEHNAMSMRRIEFGPSFVVIRALRDQAERAGLEGDDLDALDAAIDEAEAFANANRRAEAAARLRGAADDLGDEFPELAQALRDLAAIFDVDLTRLSGAGRIQTAVAISQDDFEDGGADTVILARADEFADALAGTPLAVAVNAPLLLTPSNQLHADTAAEIERVLPLPEDDGEGDDNGEGEGDEVEAPVVHVLGGTNAIDDSVVTELEDAGYEVVRIFGTTRVETSVAIAEVLGVTDAFMIARAFQFPDALTAGAAAGHVGGAVLLTTDDTPHPAVEAFLDENAAEDAQVFAVGGAAARAFPEAEPVFGSTRFTTATAVAETFFEDPSSVGFARHNDFPDALAGGAHIARRGGPVLLTQTTALHPAPEAWLCENAVDQVFIYGGTAAIDDDTADTIAERAAGFGCAEDGNGDDNGNGDGNGDDNGVEP